MLDSAATVAYKLAKSEGCFMPSVTVIERIGKRTTSWVEAFGGLHAIFGLDAVFSAAGSGAVCAEAVVGAVVRDWDVVDPGGDDHWSLHRRGSGDRDFSAIPADRAGGSNRVGDQHLGDQADRAGAYGGDVGGTGGRGIDGGAGHDEGDGADRRVAGDGGQSDPVAGGAAVCGVPADDAGADGFFPIYWECWGGGTWRCIFWG